MTLEALGTGRTGGVGELDPARDHPARGTTPTGEIASHEETVSHDEPEGTNPLASVLADTIRDLAASRADCGCLRAEVVAQKEVTRAAVNQLAEALQKLQRLREVNQRQSELVRGFMGVEMAA